MSNFNFSNQVRKYAQKINADLGDTCKAIKINLFSQVIFNTRVDTGRLRGNWQTSTGAPKFQEIDRKFPEGTSNSEMQKEVIENVTAFGVDYLTNNLPYAEVWNERDGIIDKAIARTNRTIKEVINK